MTTQAWANQVSSLFVELPIGETDLPRRYDRTRAGSNALKSGTALLGALTAFQVAGAAPPRLHEPIAQPCPTSTL
jgi:hypothetical protein